MREEKSTEPPSRIYIRKKKKNQRFSKSRKKEKSQVNVSRIKQTHFPLTSLFISLQFLFLFLEFTKLHVIEIGKCKKKTQAFLYFLHPISLSCNFFFFKILINTKLHEKKNEKENKKKKKPRLFILPLILRRIFPLQTTHFSSYRRTCSPRKKQKIQEFSR